MGKVLVEEVWEFEFRTLDYIKPGSIPPAWNLGFVQQGGKNHRPAGLLHTVLNKGFELKQDGGVDHP